jgi:hypothetical protein
MKSITRTLWLLPIFGLLSACYGPSNSRTGSPGEVHVQSNREAGITIDGIFNADGTLDRSPLLGKYFPGTSLRLVDMRSAPTESGFIEVQATIENANRKRERIEYRYRWLDAYGMEVAAGTSGWRSETIEPKESRALIGVSREPGMRSFQLFVRTYEPKK